MYQEILQQMKKHKETQQDLANVLQLDQPEVSRRIRGRAKWKIEEIKILCEHYNMKFEKLFRKE